MAENALERFIRKTRELFAAEADVDKRWSGVPPILKELMADPEVRESCKAWPTPGRVEGRGGNLLFYEDPDYGFVVNGQIHEVNRRAPSALEAGRNVGEPKAAHDHGQNYTAYGLLDGHERIVLYQRTDDGSKPDYAEVKKTGDYVAGPGDVHLAEPGAIHMEVNIGERTAAVIIRAMKDGVPTNLHGRFDLETNKYHESMGPRQVPAEMLPKKGI